MMAKTPAMKSAGMGMVGMGGARSAGYVPEKFGSVSAGEMITDFTLTGTDGKPVTRCPRSAASRCWCISSLATVRSHGS